MDFGKLKKIGSELGLIALYLHGSYALGNARSDSDFDFAYLPLYDADVAAIEDALLPLLAGLCGCSEFEIDLQNLRQAPPHFRVRVLGNGRLVQLGDSTALARFHASSVSEDRDLEHYLRPFRQAMRERIRSGRYAS